MGGKFLVKAGLHKFESGERVSSEIPMLPSQEIKGRQFEFKDDQNKPYINHPYAVWSESGYVVKGITDEFGLTQIIPNEREELIAHLILSRDNE